MKFAIENSILTSLFIYFRRKGLRTALAGRDAKALLAILRFLVKYIGDYRYTRTVTDVSSVLLGKVSSLFAAFSCNSFMINLHQICFQTSTVTLGTNFLQMFVKWSRGLLLVPSMKLLSLKI